MMDVLQGEKKEENHQEGRMHSIGDWIGIRVCMGGGEGGARNEAQYFGLVTSVAAGDINQNEKLIDQNMWQKKGGDLNPSLAHKNTEF